jgi:hypothetical protein
MATPGTAWSNHELNQLVQTFLKLMIVLVNE